ncbi:MAG: hypothetical protein NC911_08395 [Candidatus Omnitrophica bacterium]|nr:hypothetical protein [Candidatus Omnitrophota bacterium]
MKKSGLGKDPLSWIRPTKPSPVKEPSVTSKASSLPKFKTFEVRLTTLLRDDQLEFLERLVREIRKKRTAEYRKERITKNTLFRAFIDAFMDARLDLTNIPDEETLVNRLKKLVKP